MIDPISILAAVDPITHVVDKPLLTNSSGSIWFISNVTIMLILGAVVTGLLIVPAARRIQPGQSRTIEDFRTQGTAANLVEMVCLYLRNEVFRPILEDETDRYCPILWTFFWFILISNLMGLIPIADFTAMLGWGHHGHGIGGTATQSIWVTAALACIAFLFYNGMGLLNDPIGYVKHLTMGAPWFMWIITVPIEIIGALIKPFALAIRLFANMTGGHLVIAVMLGFVGPLVKMAGAGKAFLLFPFIGALAINILEVLVAFIQAYIFTFLTCLFLGQLVVHEHEEHEHAEAH